MTDQTDTQSPPSESTTDLLRRIAEACDSETLTVGALVDQLSGRGFGVVQLVLALPVCIPFLYGIPQAVAVPMMFVALQIATGRQTLWLPEKARSKTISRDSLATMADRAAKYVGWFERIARPSLIWATRGTAERIAGAFMAIFCASILVPLPATNTMPGIGVAIMSIGFLERDGRLVVLGGLIGTLWVSLLLFFGITLGVEGLHLLKSYF
ncbi:MAG: exopolysaccharide biosynthesis protein [Alphaproteobacteria bacterium]|nr:MAG: exopolysaccharide biosynthesis protein [Alphaproteobacteria bacterium]